jgi:hypothetical protein
MYYGKYTAEHSKKDVGDIIPEFSVAGVLRYALSVICGGISNTFFHSVQCS